MIIVKTVAGVPVRLTDERWKHIRSRHPEIDHQARVLETVAEPEMVLKGDVGELLALRFYDQSPIGPKYLVVAYRELDPTDGFILTAYYTGRPAHRREIIWKQ
jgi:hypothetical protein